MFIPKRHQLSTQHSESENQTHLVIDFTELQFLHKNGIAIAHFKLVGTNLHHTETSSILIQLQKLQQQSKATSFYPNMYIISIVYFNKFSSPKLLDWTSPCLSGWLM